jgi:hypothetical protein
MNDDSQITPVIFNEATRAFNFQLPPSACDNVLLSHFNKKGLTLCHSNNDELETFRQKLITLTDKAKANVIDRRRAGQRKMVVTLFFAVLICVFVYTSDFFGKKLFHRWLFNFITIFLLFAMNKNAPSYLSRWKFIASSKQSLGVF